MQVSNPRRPDEEGVAIPTGSVTRFERSRGRRSNAGRGAVIGGASIGAAVLILGVGASRESSGWGPDIGAEDVALGLSLWEESAQGLAHSSAASKGERWEPLAIPDE